MSGSLDRRGFLKGSLMGSVALAALSFEEQALPAAAQGGAGTARETGVQDLPAGKIGDVTISRPICGGKIQWLAQCIPSADDLETDASKAIDAGEQLLRKTIGPDTTTMGWAELSVDLSRFAGKSVKLELVNEPTDWRYEASYWSKIAVLSE